MAWIVLSTLLLRTNRIVSRAFIFTLEGAHPDSAHNSCDLDRLASAINYALKSNSNVATENDSNFYVINVNLSSK